MIQNETDTLIINRVIELPLLTLMISYSFINSYKLFFLQTTLFFICNLNFHLSIEISQCTLWKKMSKENNNHLFIIPYSTIKIWFYFFLLLPSFDHHYAAMILLLLIFFAHNIFFSVCRNYLVRLVRIEKAWWRNFFLLLIFSTKFRERIKKWIEYCGAERELIVLR